MLFLLSSPEEIHLQLGLPRKEGRLHVSLTWTSFTTVYALRGSLGWEVD